MIKLQGEKIYLAVLERKDCKQLYEDINIERVVTIKFTIRVLTFYFIFVIISGNNILMRNNFIFKRGRYG